MLPEIFENIDKNLLKKFALYHKENPDVWEAFQDKAHEMYNHGKSKYSGWVIINVIRWEHDILNSEPFKINNDFIALYVRLMIHFFPEFDGFFELRKMKPSGRKDAREEYQRRKKKKHND